MPSAEKLLSSYDYPFPKELIAHEPASPRDSARLLVYDRRTKRTSFDTFAHILEYLPPRAVLVCNQTKVIPARIVAQKESGGRVRLLYIGTRGAGIEVLSDRKLAIGSKLTLTPRHFFVVEGQSDGRWLLNPSFPIAQLPSVLRRHGVTPLPPYIKHSSLDERTLRKEYQAVFARESGSVAAPTASLHFSRALLKKLERAGVSVRFVTLHVNLGTFAPVAEEQLAKGILHKEEYAISRTTASFLERAKRECCPIIAVGTTVVRTLESACGEHAEPAADRRSHLPKRSGSTDLFIREGYRFKFVDGIITNFHIPKSSLLMLVSAFVRSQRRRARHDGFVIVRKLYRAAIRRRFRLFSFGDTMLIL